MKITGATKETVKEIVAAIDPHLGFKAQKSTSGELYGFLTYGSAWVAESQGKYKAKIKKVNGSTETPCAHATLAAVHLLISVGKAKEVVAEKLHFNKFAGSYKYSSLFNKLNATYSCGCKWSYIDVVDSAKSKLTGFVAATSTPPAAAPKPKPKPGGYILLEDKPAPTPAPPPTPKAKPMPGYYSIPFKPLEGEAIDRKVGGGAELIQKSKYRPAHLSVTGFYVLEEIAIGLQQTLYQEGQSAGAGFVDGWEKVGLNRIKERETNKSIEFICFMTDFEEYYESYRERLMDNMFDYLTMICVGEARHHGSVKWPVKRPQSRSEAYIQALQHDPRYLLPACESIFGNLKWGGSYGGPKWANIAKQTALYFKHKSHPAVFVDHVVDLSHNGGIAFNKGYIINLEIGQSEYIQMLDTKRKGSLLQSGLNLHVPLEMLRFIRSAVRFGLIPEPKAKINWKGEPLNIPTLKWGSLPWEPLSSIDGFKTPPPGSPVEAPTVAYDYPTYEEDVPLKPKPHKAMDNTFKYPPSRRHPDAKVAPEPTGAKPWPPKDTVPITLGKLEVGDKAYLEYTPLTNLAIKYVVTVKSITADALVCSWEDYMNAKEHHDSGVFTLKKVKGAWIDKGSKGPSLEGLVEVKNMSGTEYKKGDGLILTYANGEFYAVKVVEQVEGAFQGIRGYYTKVGSLEQAAATVPSDTGANALFQYKNIVKIWKKEEPKTHNVTLAEAPKAVVVEQPTLAGAHFVPVNQAAFSTHIADLVTAAKLIPNPVSDKNLYTVKITDIGLKKVLVVKVVHEITGQPLKTVLDMLNNIDKPLVVVTGLNTAMDVQLLLMMAGAAAVHVVQK